MNHKIDRDTYIIPPNFIESGTFFGGMFKARNVIEAGILAFAIGVPVFSLLPLSLTARIIALCLTALPAALVALIGISGESLSSFLLIFIKYLRNRRIIGGNSAEDAVPAAEHGGKHIKKKVHKPDKAPRRSRRSGREDFPAEFDEVRSYEIRQKLRPVKKPALMLRNSPLCRQLQQFHYSAWRFHLAWYRYFPDVQGVLPSGSAVLQEFSCYCESACLFLLPYLIVPLCLSLSAVLHIHILLPLLLCL